MNTVGWPDPEKTAEQVISHGLSNDSLVLDMGCGTGLVAAHLIHKSTVKGYTLVGIDASQQMLDRAAARGIYQSLHKTMLCNLQSYKENFSSLEGKFDFVTASGLLAEGHATNEVFAEMIYSLK